MRFEVSYEADGRLAMSVVVGYSLSYVGARSSVVERSAHNRLVAGSIPAGPTKLDKIKNFHLEVQVSSLTLALG